LSFSTANSQAKINSEIGRVKMGANLATFKAEVETISSLSYDNLDQALISGEKHLSSARDFLNLITEAINSAVNVSATDLSVYKTNINIARTNLNTAISNINSQKQLISSQKITNQNNIVTAQNKINEAENSLKVYQDQLALKKSGATVEQIIAQESKVKQARLNIEVQESKVKQAEAEIDNIYAQLAKNVLKSPIKGIVTAQNAKVGEIISLNSLVVSVISQDKFELKANVPEADIAKIKKTNQVQVTLDAYDNETIFKAEIFSIDPAEKIIEGVATYKITAKFIEQDERIKSGMTADMNIITAEKKDILIIPSRTIYEKDGKNTVKILLQQKKKEIVEEREIKTGLKGSEGKIEVLGGLQVGDKIIMP